MATANASLVLVISAVHGRPSELVQSSTAPHQAVNALANFLNGAVSGEQYAKIDAYSSTAAPAAASGTFTLASAADTDTLVLGGTTLTAKTSPSGSAQFLRGVSDTADAAAAAACINAHPTLSQVFAATSALGVVTVTCNTKGVCGNFYATTATGNITANQTKLAGGTGGVTGAATTYRHGL